MPPRSVEVQVGVLVLGVVVFLVFWLLIIRQAKSPSTAERCNQPRSDTTGKICVLVLSVGAGGGLEESEEARRRWQGEKDVWRRYMHARLPRVVCRFIECGSGAEEDVVYCACEERQQFDTTLWKKTALALSQTDLSAYDYVVRPNLNMFVIFDNLYHRLYSTPFDPRLHTGGQTTLTFASGSCMIFGRECALAMTSTAFLGGECHALEDVCLSQKLMDLGFPLQQRDPPWWHVWKDDVSQEDNFAHIDANCLCFVRTKEVKRQETVQNALIERYYSPSA